MSAERVQEGVAGPGRVSAHEDGVAGRMLTDPARKLGEGVDEHRDVIGGRVGTGVTVGLPRFGGHLQ